MCACQNNTGTVARYRAVKLKIKFLGPGQLLTVSEYNVHQLYHEVSSVASCGLTDQLGDSKRPSIYPTSYVSHLSVLLKARNHSFTHSWQFLCKCLVAVWETKVM